MNKLKIELGGNERTLKFNMLFLEEWDKINKGSTSEVKNTVAMIYAAIKANCLVTDTQMDCTFEDVCDWTEELFLNDDGTVITKILEAYQQSTVYKFTEKALKKKEADNLITTAMNSGQIGTELNGTPLEKSASGLPIITI